MVKHNNKITTINNLISIKDHFNQGKLTYSISLGINGFIINKF
jgi:hypothetical protein